MTAKPRGIISVISRQDRGGDWELPEHWLVWAVLGDVRLDLRQARFHPGVSEIRVFAAMGQVRITVPHGVRVECNGGGLLEEFKLKRVSNALPRPDAPLLRITGSAYMGSVIVRVVDPNERR